MGNTKLQKEKSKESHLDASTPRFHGFDHIVFWVGNAKQTATYYCIRFGFKRVFYRGLETGHRDMVSHVLQKNGIYFLFQSPLNPDDETSQKMGSYLMKHGDNVRSIALCVNNCRAIYAKAIERGGKSIQEPYEEEDENGKVIMASIATYGDTIHTFVERKSFKGHFLPNYQRVNDVDPVNDMLPDTNILIIDHCVGNQPDNEMIKACELYEHQLEFKRFWSVDDKEIHTQYSALRSIVMTDQDETVKMPINEPAPGKRKSQIQEFVDYYGGAGVQHIALRTNDIVQTVTNLRVRGCEFLPIPDSYYDLLRNRLKNASVQVKEDINILKHLQILIDFDEKGYLLQIFTKPVEDRPTLFLEIIQRNNHQGFGAGNFKSLFEAIEHEQEKRGNLY